MMLLLALLAILGVSNAQASPASLTAIPTNWRLEDYAGGDVRLYFAGSPCANGALLLQGATEAERNRLWALILAAKLSNHGVFVYYESTNCAIISFGMDG